MVSKPVELGGGGGREEEDGRGGIREAKRKKLLFSSLEASIGNNSGISAINGGEIIRPVAFSRSLFPLSFSLFPSPSLFFSLCS